MMLAPDPPPNSGAAPITYVAYSYVTPAVNVRTHRIIPGQWYRCHVPVTGRRRCIRFTR